MKNDQYKKDLAYLIIRDYLQYFLSIKDIDTTTDIEQNKSLTLDQASLLDKVANQRHFKHFIEKNKLTEDFDEDLTAIVCDYTDDLIKVILNSGLVKMDL